MAFFDSGEPSVGTRMRWYMESISLFFDAASLRTGCPDRLIQVNPAAEAPL
jgi:hypothetical protein